MPKNPETDFRFEVTVSIEGRVEGGITKLYAGDAGMSVSDNLDQTKYFKGDGVGLTKEGYKAMANTLIQGIIGTVRGAGQDGAFNEGVFMKWIVDEIGRAFVAQSTVDTAPTKKQS